MPFKYIIFSHQKKVVVEADENIDLSSILEVIRDVASENEFESYFDIIIDLRKIKYFPTTPEIFTIRDYVNSMKQFYQGNITLLMSKEKLFLAKLISLLAKPYHIKMKATLNSKELEELECSLKDK